MKKCKWSLAIWKTNIYIYVCIKTKHRDEKRTKQTIWFYEGYQCDIIIANKRQWTNKHKNKQTEEMDDTNQKQNKMSRKSEDKNESRILL